MMDIAVNTNNERVNTKLTLTKETLILLVSVIR